MHRLRFASGIAALLGLVASVSANEMPGQSFWQFQTSAYTRHHHPEPDHNNHQKLIGVEYNDSKGWLYGVAAFHNSHDQPSQYGYFGKRFDSASVPAYLKLSGGLIHGYKGKYQDKIPFNRFGIAPSIVPALGIHVGPATAELNIIGVAALMVTVGWRVY